jgi:hypothetical protein
MTTDAQQIKKHLATVSAALKERLIELPGLRIKRQHSCYYTDTAGRSTLLATWGPERPQVELWLDQATGGSRHRFWFGFVSNSEQIMRSLIELLPDDLAPPKEPCTSSDWRPISWSSPGYALRSLRQKELTQPFWEAYRKDKEFFFGMYDWGGPASTSPPQLDISRAAKAGGCRGNVPEAPSVVVDTGWKGRMLGGSPGARHT